VSYANVVSVMTRLLTGFHCC